MLSNLSFKNFAILEDGCFELSKGLNVITGETGAGKSILISALSMVLGDKTIKESIRPGKEFCEVVAEFTIDNNIQIKEFLITKDIETEGLIVRRKINLKGSGKCYINDCPVALNTLKALGELLIDIHSQNQHQSILKKEYQLMVLDRYSNTSSELETLQAVFKDINSLEKKQQQLIEDKNITEFEIEQYRKILKDIKSLNIYPGIDDDIEEKYTFLNNFGILNSGVTEVCEELYEKDGAVSEIISLASKKVSDMSEIVPMFKDYVNILENAYTSIETVSENLRTYIEQEDHDTASLETLMSERDKLNVLKRQYGDVAGILAQEKFIIEKIAEYDNFDNILDELTTKIDNNYEKASKIAELITKKRKSSAKRLSLEIKTRLSALEMPDCELKVELLQTELSETGRETAVFMIRPNPGYDFLELSRIASGGEISRIMLAIKSAIADSDKIPVLVFDEIDSGLSAEVARSAGSELNKLSDYHQLIVITHMPQIAALAHQHINLTKKVQKDKTVTSIKVLKKEDRISEIARMLGGSNNKIMDMHAREILKVKGEQ